MPTLDVEPKQLSVFRVDDESLLGHYFPLWNFEEATN